MIAAGGWLLASGLGLLDSAAQNQLVQQGAAAVRNVISQPSGTSGSSSGGVVGRVGQVGATAVRNVIGAPPTSQAQPQAGSNSGQPTTQPTSQPSTQQGGVMGTVQQVGGNALSKATGGKVSSSTAQTVIGGAGTLAQKAISKRSTPAAPPTQTSAPQQQGLPVGWPTPKTQRPATGGARPSGAPPS